MFGLKTSKIATRSTLLLVTFLIIPTFFGTNYKIFRRYGIASIKKIIGALAGLLLAISLTLLVLIFALETISATAFNAQSFWDWSKYLAIAFGCVCGFLFVWWIVDTILALTGNFKDCNGQKVDKNYKGMKYLTRAERKTLKASK